jgi:hypothetical protein
MIFTYDFYKEKGMWYIDFPQYIANGGSKSDLLMVRGADTMLEKLSGGKRVELTFSADVIPYADIKLTKLFGDPWGATYKTNRKDLAKLVWLCNVTKVVMGGHPKNIYIYVNNKKESIAR